MARGRLRATDAEVTSGSKNGPVAVTRIAPVLWARVLELTDGKPAGRFQINEDGSITVDGKQHQREGEAE